MANQHTHDDLGSLVIGAAEVVCALDSVTWDQSADTVDVRGACRFGALNQVVKDQATLTAKAFGAGTGGYRTSHMDLTALTLGGVNIVPVMYRLTLQGAFDKQPLPGIGVLGKSEGVTGKNYSGSIDLQIDDTDIVQAIILACESRDISDREMVLSFGLGGTITLPVLLSGNNHSSSPGEFQKISVNFMGQAPAKPTAYPTAPTSLPGSPGLLSYALVTPKENLAFTFNSHVTDGLTRTGYLTWDSFSLTVADGEIVDYSYTLKTFGDWEVVLSEEE